AESDNTDGVQRLKPVIDQNLGVGYSAVDGSQSKPVLKDERMSVESNSGTTTVLYTMEPHSLETIAAEHDDNSKMSLEGASQYAKVDGQPMGGPSDGPKECLDEGTKQILKGIGYYYE
ncbi:hypothetical protein MPER_03228, partial [Moniliophthora perniciosa FA553]